MILTNDNYYSNIANQIYMSVSQYKQFLSCEAAAMASLSGQWSQTPSTALLIGSYVDAWFEGTLQQFLTEHPELYTRTGKLRSEFFIAERMIEKARKDSRFMEHMNGIHQGIFTAELFGSPWKIKIDSLLPDKIVDLKCMRSMQRVMGKSFVEHWGYDIQMAVYAAVYKAVTGKDLETYLAVITKQEPPDLEIIEIPAWHRGDVLIDVKRHMPHILAVKRGEIPPERCGVCDYCRATKRVGEPIDFQLVGLSAAEQKIITGRS